MMHAVRIDATGDEQRLQDLVDRFSNNVAMPMGVEQARALWSHNPDSGSKPIHAHFAHCWETNAKNDLLAALEDVLSICDDYEIRYHLCEDDEPDGRPCEVMEVRTP